MNKPVTNEVELSNLEQRMELLQSTVGFEELSRQDLLPLAEKSRFRSYNRNQFIFYEGDPAEDYHIVARGRVRLCKLSANGKIFTTTVTDRGDALNAVVLFDGSPRFLSAQALEDCVVLSMPRETFVSFVLSRPEVAVRIITILGRGAKSINERILDIVAERVEQRVINILFMLYYKFGNPLKITNRELADLAGTTTETAIRVVRQLCKDGVVQTSRGQIRITSPSLLETVGRGPFWPNAKPIRQSRGTMIWIIIIKPE